MKRGFTLIELLAILAILAIIALITTPIVLNIIDTTKTDAFEQSANSLVTAIRNYQNSGDNFGKAIEINLETDDKNNLKIDGDYPDAGKISIDEQSKVKLAIWDDDVKKCATKNLTAKSVTINETITSESNCLNAFNSL